MVHAAFIQSVKLSSIGPVCGRVGLPIFEVDLCVADFPVLYKQLISCENLCKLDLSQKSAKPFISVSPCRT